MPNKLSEKTVEQVFDHLVEAGRPLQVNEIAEALGIHKTTVGRALRECVERDVAQRTVGASVHGHPPYLYSTSDTQATLPVTDEKPARRDSNKNRPVSGRRVKRGEMTGLVRDALSNWSPSGRGFTVYQMHKKIGRGSYEAVRVAVAELVMTGEIIRTDKCRKGAHVHRPAAAAPPAPITAPSAPPVPANLTGLEALVAERREVQARLAADEKRLVEIDTALDKARELLA